MPVIQLQSATKIYRKSHLGREKESVGISDVTLEIERGEAFGLLGLNGSGKTTTIKLLLGLLYPTKGKVSVLGKVMPDLDVLSRIGYLPEAAYINKYLTGREAVTLFAKLSGIAHQSIKGTVESVLEKVGMRQTAHKRVSEYSKGMAQRISIAQALLHDPDILILDEPITGLDPLAIREIRELVLWLKRMGKTIFLSSHSISEVEKVCDRIGILVNGRVDRLITADEWKDKKGWLEDAFTKTVKRSENIGPLKFDMTERISP
jgi:ABC-2 type transport system ATP-binding protein